MHEKNKLKKRRSWRFWARDLPQKSSLTRWYQVLKYTSYPKDIANENLISDTIDHLMNSGRMYETSVKSDENLMKIIENQWKSMKILWKSDENLWQHHSSNERRVGNSPHNLQSTTAALNGAWEIPRKIYEAPQQHRNSSERRVGNSPHSLQSITTAPQQQWTARGKFPAQFTKHHSSTERRMGNSPHNLQSTTAAPQEQCMARLMRII